MNFSEELIQWYKLNKRDLPWRETTDPYLIWLSEIILQQTKVIQGLPYYLKFIAAYPKVELLAQAPEDSVLKLWQGLGYYSRARNLHHTAKAITNKYQSQFPQDFQAIRQLKGIGNYTAAAICSFAYQMPFAVVDGNVIRVLSRYFGIQAPADDANGKLLFEKLANELLDKKASAIYNQAIMEFGALQCVPKSPNCLDCPLNTTCFAYHNKMVTQLPFKTKKLKLRKRHLNFLIIECNDYVLLQKIHQNIWKGLYQFPVIETEKETSETEIKNTSVWEELFTDTCIEITKISSIIPHQLTHQILYAKFWHIKTNTPINSEYLKVNTKELDNYPLSRLIEKYLIVVGLL